MYRAALALAVFAIGCAASGACSGPAAPADLRPDAAQDAGVRDGGSTAGLPACPAFDEGVETGRTPAGMKEASGIVESRRNPGVLWLHEDSGASARLHAVDRTGRVVGVFDLQGAEAHDWEDMAIGPGPQAGVAYLYVGDIGDNPAARAHVDVYRVPEPEVVAAAPSQQARTLSGVERFRLTYPDRAHNAETLLVDPKTGDVFVVEKSGAGISRIFRAAAPLSTSGTAVTQQVGVLDFGSAALPGGRLTTGGDISPAGDAIVIRTYDSAFLWRRVPESTVAKALATRPCPLRLRPEPQGAAIGFAADGEGFFTTSEGSSQPIYFYQRK